MMMNDGAGYWDALPKSRISTRRLLGSSGRSGTSKRCRVVGSARLIGMKSRLAKEAERALVDATQRLSPEERVSAFLEHCRLVMELYEAAAQRLSRWLR
jgi:hypothetical protein